MIDFYREVRERLDMDTVARHWGYEPNRGGYVHCIYHREKTASMKLYRDGFHCFGCGAHGSVIDFTAELLNLSPLDAVKRLNTDFSLGLNLDRKELTPQEQQQLHRRQELQEVSNAYEHWRDGFINLLNSAFREGHLIMINWPGRLTEREILAVKWHEALEYWSDILSFGSMEEQMKIYRNQEDIERLCRRILKNMHRNSKVA